MAFQWAPAAEDLRGEMLGRDLSAITDTQLQSTIDRIAETLSAELGALLLDRWEPVAHAYVLYAAAAQVELRLFPEQQVSTNGPAARYDLLAGAELTRLRRGLGLIVPDSDGGSDGGGTALVYATGAVPMGSRR